MSKIDCTNIYNFMSEWERRRKAEPDEKWLALTGLTDLKIFNPFLEPNHLDKVIEELQDWSDTHPKITRADKFRRICKENGLPDPEYCVNTYGCPYCIKHLCCPECAEYWSEEVDE